MKVPTTYGSSIGHASRAPIAAIPVRCYRDSAMAVGNKSPSLAITRLAPTRGYWQQLRHKADTEHQCINASMHYRSSLLQFPVRILYPPTRNAGVMKLGPVTGHSRQLTNANFRQASHGHSWVSN